MIRLLDGEGIPKELVSPFSAEAYAQNATLLRTPISVFLAGPFIDPNGPAPCISASPAAWARFTLFHKLSNDGGIRTVLGEHKGLIGAYEDAYEDLGNAAFTEISHIVNESDAVIILPSSPGSFSELGYFSVVERACAKMLILLNKEFENDKKSYVQLGPVKMAVMHHAHSVFVDYRDAGVLWQHSENFLRRIQRKKQISKFTIR